MQLSLSGVEERRVLEKEWRYYIDAIGQGRPDGEGLWGGYARF